MILALTSTIHSQKYPQYFNSNYRRKTLNYLYLIKDLKSLKSYEFYLEWLEF